MNASSDCDVVTTVISPLHGPLAFVQERHSRFGVNNDAIRTSVKKTMERPEAKTNGRVDAS
jgi:hypothetical protein